MFWFLDSYISILLLRRVIAKNSPNHKNTGGYAQQRQCCANFTIPQVKPELVSDYTHNDFRFKILDLRFVVSGLTLCAERARRIT
jgi:hypothetical protein